MDVLELLAGDHRNLQAALSDYRGLAGRAFHSKELVSGEIFDALERHARIEEEVFYPELETSTETADFVRDARREHEEMRLLVNALRETDASDPSFDSRMRALEEMVAAHIGEEEEEVFPAARTFLGAAALDALGARAAGIRAELESSEETPPIPPVGEI